MVAVTRADIAARAYQIWESEGRPNGQEVCHWLRAETELSAAVVIPVVATIPLTPRAGVALRRSKKREGVQRERSASGAAKLSP